MTAAVATSTTTADELDFLGSRARILIGAEQTDGRFSLIDMIEVPAGHMPALHVHHAEDEIFYVVDGEVTLYLPGRQIDCRPGDCVLAPRGIPHAYRVGDRPARWLIMSSPAGFERFVSSVAALETLDPATLTAVAAEHRCEILGPPGTLP
ncbi:MAG: cupin domain-containing protein [Solirubrobacteraceae bacterium]|nr:cupin domain-containing protein [Solirubrobacteraceae bacterium]